VSATAEPRAAATPKPFDESARVLLNAPQRVLFWVQHLVGIGHLKRSSVLVCAMLDRGLDVTVVTGGVSVPGTDFGSATIARLPPLRARDVKTYDLVDEQGRRPGPLFWWRRKRELLRIFERVDPHALIIDLFPFGRMQFRGELIPLLDAAAARGCVRFSSMRDVVQPKTKERDNERMVTLAEKHFDRLLIHGDPSLLTLDQSLPAVSRIAQKLEYTGYVVEEERPAAPAAPSVVVSVGGGAVGEELLRTALAARPLTRFHAQPWHLLCGINFDPRGVEALRREAPEGVLVEQHRDDFSSLLRGALASVSQAGYNTAMELLAARVPSVLVPFVADGETEQSVRCRALASRGLAQVVTELTPQSLAAAIDNARRPPDDLRIDLGGAQRTATLVHDAIEAAQRKARDAR
jgi:predicted glycosyltransferase